MKVAWLISVLVLLLTPAMLALEIVADGKSAHVIVGEAQNPAVQDLRLYIARMTGVELEILDPGMLTLPEQVILVDPSVDERLQPQEYRLRVVGQRVEIRAGGADGLSHGVYGLLDDHWGCRFLTRQEDYVPERARLSLPDELDESRGPSIRDRMNGSPHGAGMADATWRRRNRMSCEIYGHANHDLYQLLAPATYFAEHPEWYPLGVDGVRKPGCDWVCWSNAGMLEELTRLLKAKMAVTPANQYISLGQGDGFSDPCHCSECRALVEQYGSEAAPIIAGLNRVLPETRREYPLHQVVIFAYYHTDVPPIKGEQRLIPDPSICFTFVRMGDAMKNLQAPVNRGFREKLEGWRSLTEKLQIWSWSVGFRNALLPFPNYRAMAEDTQWYAGRVQGVMHQMYANGEWGLLRDWLLARTMWDTTLDITATQKDFLRHYYGEAAAPWLWTILERSQEAAAKSTFTFNAVFDSAPEVVRPRLFPDEEIAFYREAWQGALAAAATDPEPLHATRVKETFGRSFAMLDFAIPRPLARVMVEKDDWLLPGGDAVLARSVTELSEILTKTTVWEWAGYEVGRRRFLNNAGGPLAPIIANNHLQAAFCMALDGNLASLVERSGGREWLGIGSSGKGQLTGLHPVIGNHGASDSTFTVSDEDGAEVVRISGPVVTGPWMVFKSFQHERVYRFPRDRSGFTVESYLVSDSRVADFVFFSREQYNKAPFNLVLGEPIYAPGLDLRLNVAKPEDVAVMIVSPDFTLTQELPVGAMSQVPLPVERTADGMLRLYFIGLDPERTLALSTPWHQWEQIGMTHEAASQQLVLRFSGAKAMAVKDQRVPTGTLQVDILTKEEAERRQPIAALTVVDRANRRPELKWAAVDYAALAGYHVHAAHEGGAFAQMTTRPLTEARWQPEEALADGRWRFHVTHVDGAGIESAPSPLAAWRGNSGLEEGTMLVANDGTGDFMSLGAALAALPTAAWSKDFTIEIKDTSALFPHGYDGATVPGAVVAAAQGRMLHLIGLGGKAILHGPIVLNDGRSRVTVRISNLRFVAPTECGILMPGAGSRIADNTFEGIPFAIKLPNLDSNAGSVIERNYFRDISRLAIHDAGAGRGGTEESPFIIRNNLFVNCPTMLHLCNPTWSYFIHNSCDKSSMRVDLEPTFTIANNIFAFMRPFTMIRSREQNRQGGARIDGNVFWRTTPMAVYESNKPGEQTLSEWQASYPHLTANRELAPLWMGNDEAAHREEQPVPQLAIGHQVGAHPEAYRLRPESACREGGLPGLPVGEVDFLGESRPADRTGVGAFQ